MQLYLYNISGGVTGPAETNTGLIFITPDTVDRYLETESRFEGDSGAAEDRAGARVERGEELERDHGTRGRRRGPGRRNAGSSAGCWSASFVCGGERLLVLVGLAIYFQAANSAFLSEQNILSLAQYAVPYVVIASALCMLLICGEIDLSVGQSFAFAPIVMYLAYEKLFLYLPLAVLVGLLAVALVGLVNGLITVYLGVSSLITTLGMFFLLAGLNVTLTGGFPATTPETNYVTQALGRVRLVRDHLGLLIVAFLQLVLSRTRWGLHTYATGGNPLGARRRA